MSNIEIYLAQKKKRIIYTSMCSLFFLPALALMVFGQGAYVMGVPANKISMVMQVIGVAFLFLSQMYTKCPSCKKIPGNGWHVKSCKKCGETLHK